MTTTILTILGVTTCAVWLSIFYLAQAIQKNSTAIKTLAGLGNDLHDASTATMRDISHLTEQTAALRLDINRIMGDGK